MGYVFYFVKANFKIYKIKMIKNLKNLINS